MNRQSLMRNLLLPFCLGTVLAPHPLWACAACFGSSDSPLAHGMNMGILSLLGVVVFVLGGIAAFFIYLVRKSASAAASSAPAVPSPLSPQPTE